MSSPIRILIALILGVGIGAALASHAPEQASRVLAVAGPIGRMWLAGLEMTIVPLVVSLLVTGIAQSAEAAKAGGVAARTVAAILIFLWVSSAIGWLLSDLFWSIAPIPQGAGRALAAALAGQGGSVPPPPAIAAFLTGLVPTNPIAAAVRDEFLPLILFTGVFGFALTRLPADKRAPVTALFAGVADAMIVIIGWVLWLAPLGVGALALGVGAKAGLGAAGALAHYVLTLSAIGLTVMLIGYPMSALIARFPLARFARAVAPAQALAISTQSSLACLPVMLRASASLGVGEGTAGITLPMAVALFRSTGPAMNLGVALYVAHWLGIQLGPGQILVGIALGATTTLGAVSLPGQVSFLSSIAPIAAAIGAPVQPLLLLIAVEPIPDIFRTLGNVVNDVALTGVVARWNGDAARSRTALPEAKP